ncbi:MULTISPECIES: GNAT family N-acetyltransferase [unclassified Acinetobacter]|uniref:GNAT family N-acetyltransferase n=1 Tax=unclassified Acinetobacter TaxID=196816 RepID=UPI00190C7F16|nr:MULTISPECIES: GNAT family N-acetyltransferase [unclassified Acinetobacter]MBK0062105.1 GNAT family N-acetyltransferase [Acinetobacter sp. S55]MBK0065909.1 GNAT family N-acetyltransferase [Acinetobacter sp. S54]
MIKICEVDKDNCFDICELTSNKDGIGTIFEDFICCNAISLAESKYYPECKPKALYNHETLIGFFMYKHFSSSNEVEVCRFMIDYKFLGQGYGRKSFSSILDFFKRDGIKTVNIMIDDHNVIAKNLYTSFGFIFTGKILKEEYYYQLKF